MKTPFLRRVCADGSRLSFHFSTFQRRKARVTREALPRPAKHPKPVPMPGICDAIQIALIKTNSSPAIENGDLSLSKNAYTK